jgi:hypothetical protein
LLTVGAKNILKTKMMKYLKGAQLRKNAEVKEGYAI